MVLQETTTQNKLLHKSGLRHLFKPLIPILLVHNQLEIINSGALDDFKTMIT